ncbi:5-deoxy-glucuronate isomerase [Vibrio nigripulchritudo]|uniref:5-deoxy-glucuronate isomerase n=1 Tax=Vibrio nigripulchritudo TaxID=28173 RepID=UPI002490B024|nr:5-deoxy-glucuronate isomerase [Vibrio nigripulchritudo]BDU36761.1 5-deoxy-glucuronate isomerase [Vibrio nigripulchritudo]BDU42471.1 5-deoxy-glucuronate isomerase [Vibrio nigripulchritudo]
MSDLLSKMQPRDEAKRTQHITPESAGWTYIGFDVVKLKEGEDLEWIADNGQELCIVLVSGKASLDLNGGLQGEIGQRMSPFEKTKPYAVYLTLNDKCSLTATTDVELAVCRAPGKRSYPSRLITPQEIGAEHRGKGRNQRQVHNILPDDEPADSLLVVEVYTDEGCTSSYPSHKHDQNDPPNETQLEETYYHRLNPPQGFCFQRVYTDDRTLDESMAVYDGDVVQVPRGYHPVATVAGYNSYYLNVMAGPVRKWLFSWEEDHQWVNTESYR